MSKAKRYKEPKTLKAVLIMLILMLITACGVLFIQPDVQMRIASLADNDVRKYESSEYAKDTFTRGDMKYLPVRISKRDQTISKEDIKRDMQKVGLTASNFSPDDDRIKNGTKFKTEVGEYTILLYGDVNCDGEVDVLDAQDIIWHIVRKGNYTLTGERKTAANVEDPNKDEVDVLDALRIVNFVLGRTGLIDVLPTSDIENDHEKPVIKLEEDGEVIKLKVSTKDKPNEFDLLSGVTVTDNVDYNIKSKVQTSGYFNIEEPGIYTINYNVKDSNGNEADTKSRRFEVINYMTGIDIEKMPAKAEFANGEKIDANSMAGMKLIAKMAYTDWRVREIPLDEVTFSPDVAYVEGKEPKEQEISIIYHDKNIDEDVTEKIKIKVTPHMPKFEIDGKFENYIEIGDNSYQIPSIRAYEDEEPNEELDVTYSVKIKNGDNVETKGPFENPSDASLWIKGNLGTEYEISYTATNKYELENTVVVPVSVIDTISSISVDKDKTNLVTTQYIDGQDISLDGLAFKAIMKSGEPKTIYYRDEEDNFVLSESVAKYTDGTQQITLKYNKSYPIKDGDREYPVSDSTNVVTLSVKKKLETINQVTVNVNNGDAKEPPSSEGNIYKTVFVARFESPENEEDITESNTRVTITPNSASNSNALTYARLKPALDANDDEIPGQMDLYVAVTGSGSYKINLIPYTLGDGEEDRYSLQYGANNNLVPDSIKMTGFKKRVNNADGSFTDVPTEATMVKTGETIFTDIVYQRTVKNAELGVTSATVDVYPPDKDIMRAVVTKGSLTTALKAGTDYIYTFSEPDENEATRLEITIIKDLDTSIDGDRPQRINVQIGTDNAILGQNGSNNTAIIYNASKYTLVVGDGDRGQANETSIQINADNYNNYSANVNSNIAVSKVMNGDVASNNYYTIVPISLKDQYGPIELTGDAWNDQIRIITETNGGAANNYLDIIPVRKAGNTYIKQDTNTSVVIDKMGIAISSSVSNKTKLEELQNSAMKVSYGSVDNDKVATNMNNVTVYTNLSSTVKVEEISTGQITCFVEKTIATLTTKDDDLSFLTENEIGIKVSKNGTQLSSNKIANGSYAKNPNAEFGYMVENDENVKGTVKLTVWSKYRGEFAITPYIIGKEAETSAQGTAISRTFAHDTTINKIIIKTTNTETTSELVTGTLSSDSLNAPRGGSEIFYIKYYHDYNNGNKYEVTDVKGQDITILLNDPTGNSWASASQVANPESVDWETSNLWNVSPMENKYILKATNVEENGKLVVNATGESVDRIANRLLVYSGGKIKEGKSLTLTIKINGSKKHKDFQGAGFDFTVGEPKPLEVQVGNANRTENIIIYQTAPTETPLQTLTDSETGQDKLYKLSDGTLIYKWEASSRRYLYYTLIPVTSTIPILHEYLNWDIANIGKKDKLTFIDEDYSLGKTDENTISLAPFNVVLNNSTGKYEVKMNIDGANLTHVGIAISNGNIDIEELLQGVGEGAKVDICKTYVYKGSNEHFKEITIQAIKPVTTETTSQEPTNQTTPPEAPIADTGKVQEPSSGGVPNATTPSDTPTVTPKVTDVDTTNVATPTSSAGTLNQDENE